MATPDCPPTLIFFEPPLLVEGGTPELAASAAAASKKASKGSVGELDDVLNSVLPPRMWTQPDGTSWVQYVSKVPPSRPELAQLAAALEQRLQQRQAKGTGICAVRSELYGQLFGACWRRPVSFSSMTRPFCKLPLPPPPPPLFLVCASGD
jgi:hypothetical protein